MDDYRCRLNCDRDWCCTLSCRCAARAREGQDVGTVERMRESRECSCFATSTPIIRVGRAFLHSCQLLYAHIMLQDVLNRVWMHAVFKNKKMRPFWNHALWISVRRVDFWQRTTVQHAHEALYRLAFNSDTESWLLVLNLKITGPLMLLLLIAGLCVRCFASRLRMLDLFILFIDWIPSGCFL